MDEILLSAFTDHLHKHSQLRATQIGRYRETVEEYIRYIHENEPEIENVFWYMRTLRSKQAAAEFLQANYADRVGKTQNARAKELEAFQKYLSRHGWLELLAAWVRRRRKRALVYLSGVVITFILTLAGLASLVGLSPQSTVGKVFSTDTPTPSPTVTATFSPTETPTITPTNTPTPNTTQVAWKALLPTPNPSFTPKVRTLDDGSEQVWVPPGYFVAGDLLGIGFNDEVPHVVYTEGLWIDRFLVTNAQFSNCPQEVCGRPEEVISHKRPNGYYGVSAYSDYPVIEITWSQAQTFCEWRGGRLPTEAEWEKTAGWDPRTGETFIYPWGNQEPHKGLANYDNVDLDTTPVDRYQDGVSHVGAYDMAGNVWQWMFDWYDLYPVEYLNNPTGPINGELRVVRGGSWSNDTEPRHLRVTNRGMNSPSHANNETGFRCAFHEQ